MMKGHLSLVAVVAFIISEAWTCPGFHQHGLSYKRSVNLAHKRSKRQAEATCPPSGAYRSFDGSCHNEGDSAMGQTGSVLRRLLPAEYQDGKGMPKVTGTDTGNVLGNPRDISVRVHDPLDRLSNNNNHLVMQWGQFLDHDITLTPTGEGAGCCDSWDASQADHPDVAVGGVCDPIILPANDAYFSNAQRCMYFERSDNVTDANGASTVQPADRMDRWLPHLRYHRRDGPGPEDNVWGQTAGQEH